MAMRVLDPLVTFYRQADWVFEQTAQHEGGSNGCRGCLWNHTKMVVHLLAHIFAPVFTGFNRVLLLLLLSCTMPALCSSFLV